MPTNSDQTGRFKTPTIDGDTGAAEWHPFNVWQRHVKNGSAASADITSSESGGTGSWNAFQVWQRLIK